MRSEALSEQLEKLNAEYEAEEEKLTPSTDATTLTEMEQAIRANPVMANAIAHEGLSPREYAKVSLTMLQAGMAYAVSQKFKDFKLPAGVNPANVKFVGDHKAEIEALQKQFSSMGRVQQK